jgi:hypothetical protein
VTVIEEGKDLDALKGELVRSLQTYELSLPQPKNKKLTLRSSRKKVVESSDKESIEFEEYFGFVVMCDFLFIIFYYFVLYLKL